VLLPGCRAPRHKQKKTAKTSITPPSSQPPVKIIYPSAPGSFVKLVKRVAPSVVHLRADTPVKGGPADWFAAATQKPSPLAASFTERIQRALGSGFLIDRKGTIVTNAHLLGDRTEVRVVIHGSSKEHQAALLGKDSRYDLAVLKLDPKGLGKLKPVRKGNTKQLQAGEWLIVISNPFGLSAMASAGIVSATPSPLAPASVQPLWGHVLTSIVIHAGNSGAPVFNTLGEAIGLASATAEETPGIGFVMPIEVVARLARMLAKDGKVERPWLGMYVARPNAKKNGKRAKGALVSGVLPRGPAARGGLQRGDLIVKLDKKPIASANELHWLIAQAGVNSVITVDVIRAGKSYRFSIKTERMPE
jgi:serine protease Do